MSVAAWIVGMFLGLPGVVQATELNLDRGVFAYPLPAGMPSLVDHLSEQLPGTDGFLPPADSTAVMQASRTPKMPPYDHVSPLTLRQVWREHKPAVVGGATAFAAIIGLSLLLYRRNQALLAGARSLEQTAGRLSRISYMQHGVGQVTAELLDAPAGQRDAAIDRVLEVTGRFLNADRAYLFLVEDDGEHFSSTHEWCAAGISPQREINQGLSLNDTRWWWDQLDAQSVVLIDDVAELGTESNELRQHFERHGIRSLCGFSLSRRGRRQGFFGYDIVGDQRTWSREEILPLQVLAIALSNALSRWLAEADLERSRSFLDTLFESVPTPLFYKGTDGRYGGVNREFERFFGAERGEVVGRTVYDISPPALARTYEQKDRELFDRGGTQRYESQVRNARGELCEVIFSKAVFNDSQGRAAGLIGAIMDVTAARQQERMLELRARRDEALLQLPQAAEELDETGFMQRGLELAEGLTGSAVAFLHFVNVDQQAIELVTGSRRTLGSCCNAAFDRHYPLQRAGAWADALRQRRPVVFNDYAGSASRHELPEGHADLRCLISVPVIEDGRVVMLTVVGNKQSDYDDTDVETVSLVTSEIWRLVQRRRSLEKLELSANVFSYAREGIMVTDEDGSIVEVNTAFTEITGYTRDEAVGRRPSLLKSGRQNMAFYREMWSQLKKDGHWQGEIWNRRKNGEEFAELLTISAVRRNDDSVGHYVALFVDISTQKDYQRQLERMAHYDPLTGLPNRVLLGDRIQQALAQTRRREQMMAVAYLDLDGFKEVNDVFGHDVGDQLLNNVALRMRTVLRESDSIGRLGGDEFVIVLMDLPDTVAVMPELDRLLETVAQPVPVGDLDLRVSASIGVAFFPQEEAVDADLLLRQADQAMYQAKLAGRNRYQFFDAELDRNKRGEGETLQRIQRGVDEGEFAFHFQPKVNMRSGEIMGAEALIRWDHPDRGLLSPAQFLPFLQDRPLMVELGRLAIKTALRQLDIWWSSGLQIHISVNVDAYQLQQPDFVSWLSQELTAHPTLGPGCLILEVLETSALEDLALVSRVIRECRDIGVEFSLDDFGTGYSTLTYLKSLPAGELKIDRSFVRDCLDDPEDLAILEGILGLAAAFQRRVVAEGVETLAHGQMLLSLGCELAQGYAIARPMPVDMLEQWMRKWQSPAEWRHVRPISREDLPVLFAGVEHRAWVRRIEHCVREECSDPPLGLAQCRFAHWLDGDGRVRHGDSAQFQALRPIHQRIHRLAEELLAMKASGASDAASHRLDDLHHEIAGTDIPWVFTSGYADDKPLAFRMLDEGQPPAKYTVTLYFAEPDEIEPGRRRFSVVIQGKTVLEDFDICREAGGPRRAVVKKFDGVEVSRDLEIELRPVDRSAVRKPILCGFRAVRE